MNKTDFKALFFATLFSLFIVFVANPYLIYPIIKDKDVSKLNNTYIEVVFYTNMYIFDYVLFYGAFNDMSKSLEKEIL